MFLYVYINVNVISKRDFRVKNVESIHHWHPKIAIYYNLTSGPTMEDLREDTIFIQFSRKWIAKCWQVWTPRIQMRYRNYKFKWSLEIQFFTGIMLLFLIKGTLSGLRQILAAENPLKMIKNAFYSTLKALFILNIFQFLSWPFGL